MEKENWIESILESANGITPVTPPGKLLSRIEKRIRHMEKVPAKTVWLVAASMALLFALNVKALKKRTATKSNATEILQATLDTNNQLY